MLLHHHMHRPAPGGFGLHGRAFGCVAAVAVAALAIVVPASASASEVLASLREVLYLPLALGALDPCRGHPREPDEPCGHDRFGGCAARPASQRLRARGHLRAGGCGGIREVEVLIEQIVRRQMYIA